MESKELLNCLKGYLGTGLKMKSPYGFKPNGKELTGVSGVVYMTADLYADFENKTFDVKEFLPSLHPLSDLTKQELINLCNLTCEKEIDELFDLYFFYGNVTNLDEIKDVFDYLYKNHFDIHGLIDKGKAININK